jgi:hypothetical protein
MTIKSKGMYLLLIGLLPLTGIIGGGNPGPALAGGPKPGTYSYPLPASQERLVIELSGFQVTEKVAPNGQKMLEGKNREAGMIITGFFEPLNEKPPVHAPTPQAAREYHFTQGLAQRFRGKLTDVRLSESGPMAVVDYMIEEYQGQRVMQKNYWAYMVHDNLCIRLHLSKTPFKAGEDQLFWAILNSVRFQAK